MPGKPDDIYGDYGSVPDASSESGAGTPLSVRANADNFGGQVGSALDKAGAEGEDIGLKYQHMAVEAKANDDYANKYVPAAAELRNRYDLADGQDKVHAYQDYVGGLQQLHTTFMQQSPSPGYGSIMDSLMSRHIAGEVDGASRALGQSQMQYSAKSANDRMVADALGAGSKYNDPKATQDAIDTAHAVVLHGEFQAGYNPDDPQQKAQVQEKLNAATAQIGIAQADSALKNGDAAAALAIQKRYREVIPAHILENLHEITYTTDQRNTAVNTTAALISGAPLPAMVTAAPPVVQMHIVKTAQSMGVDVDAAMTTANIESAFGQNVGKQGTIGQTGHAVTVEDQTRDMVTALKTAEGQARTSLGREPQPWETYLTYQQGVAGGPALIKAASENPNEAAINVVMPFYKNPQTAIDAIKNNGGNVTMTAKDFADKWRDRYAKYEARSSLTPEAKANPDQIVDAYTKPGVMVQPAISPVKYLDNFNKATPGMIQRLQDLPEGEMKNRRIEEFNKSRQLVEIQAKAYTDHLTNQVMSVITKPDFIDEHSIDPETMSSVVNDRPELYHMIENYAKYNREKATGMDKGEEGSAFGDVYAGVFRGEYRDVSQLSQFVLSPAERAAHPEKPWLSPSGVTKLAEAMKLDPSIKQNMDAAFETVKGKFMASPSDDIGKANYNLAIPKMNQWIKDGFAKTPPWTLAEMQDPDSQKWMGIATKADWLTPQQMKINLLTAKNKNVYGPEAPLFTALDKAGPNQPDYEPFPNAGKMVADYAAETNQQSKIYKRGAIYNSVNAMITDAENTGDTKKVQQIKDWLLKNKLMRP